MTQTVQTVLTVLGFVFGTLGGAAGVTGWVKALVAVARKDGERLAADAVQTVKDVETVAREAPKPVVNIAAQPLDTAALLKLLEGAAATLAKR